MPSQHQHHHSHHHHHQQSTGNNAKPLGRTLAGVLSGAAANIRSKFSHLGNSGGGSQSDLTVAAAPTSSYPSQGRGNGQQQQRPYSDVGGVGGGEQSAANIPITVPGADVSKHAYSKCLRYVETFTPLDNLAFTSDFPNRLEVKPAGPRDPPAHFKRKQEYL